MFISRWDVAVAGKVPEALNNRLGIAIAGRIYKAYVEVLRNPRWQRAYNAGARPQRLLWASTGTKDPESLGHSLHQSARLSFHGEHHARGDVEGSRRSRRNWPDHGRGRRQLRKSPGRVCQGRHQRGCPGRATSGRGRKVVCEILERIAGGDRVQERRAQEQVRALLAGHPDWSRYRLSRELCLAWNWRSLNGQIKDMAARSLLLKLEERDWVALPARRCLSPNRMRHKRIRRLAHPTDPIMGSLSELQPLQIQELSRQPEAGPVFDWLLHRYHYLGYTGAVGQNVKYLVRDRQGRDLACVLFGAAAWKTRGGMSSLAGRRRSARRIWASGGQQQPVFDFALGARAGTGQPHFGPGGPAHRGGLAGATAIRWRCWRRLWNGAGSGAVVIGRPTGLRGSDARAHPAGSPARPASAGEGCLGLSPASRLSKGVVSMKLFTREELLPLARSHPEALVDIILALQERWCNWSSGSRSWKRNWPATVPTAASRLPATD
jgi:hypothetical protein